MDKWQCGCHCRSDFSFYDTARRSSVTSSISRPHADRPFNRVQVGTVRAASLARVPDVLAGFGVALDPLLDEAGLPRTLLDDAETPVELSRGIRLLALAAERTGCPHVGLLCGQSLPIEALGIVGQVARNANDVGTGLRGLILNLHLHGHAFVPVLTVTAGLAEFVLRLAPDVDENTDPAVDLGMAIAWTVLRTLCGPDWKPVEVSLARRAPAGREAYDRCFGAPVQFGREHNAIAFPATWLGQRVHGANLARRKLLERELAVMAQQNRLPVVATARRAVVAGLTLGDVSVEAGAARVGLHHRTLNRRLAREGTSVFELLKQERYRIARDLLANTPLPVSEVAATLLYASIGSFTRAFQAWSQHSPSDWRAKRGRQSTTAPPSRRGSGRRATPPGPQR